MNLGVEYKESVRRILFESGGTWVLGENERGFIYVFRAPDTYGRFLPFNIIELQPDLSRGAIYASSPCRDDPSVFRPFDFPMSEVVAVHLLSRGRGALLHAIGLDDSGRGDLFCGVSGAGKSTTARIWCHEPGVEILSDDRIIVRKDTEGFRIYGTPWHGEAQFASPHSVPLKRLFFLRQGPENKVRPLSASEAIARLMICCFPTFWDPEGMAFTLSFLKDMASTLPCYELTFVNNHTVVDFVRQL